MAWRDGVVEFQRVGESDIIYSHGVDVVEFQRVGESEVSYIHGVEGWRRRVSESRRIRDQLQSWYGEMAS